MNYAEQTLEFIKANIAAGKTVYVQNYMRCIKITPATYAKFEALPNTPLFKVTLDGLRMRNGKNYALITNTTQVLCKISAV